MLKPLHQQFADEYIKTGNATGSYMKYYTKCDRKTAPTASARLLSRQDIKDYIKEQQDKLSQRGITDIAEVLQGIIDIARDSTSSKTVKLRAFQLAGATLGMFKQQIDIRSTSHTTLTHLSDDELDNILGDDDDAN